MIIIFIALLIIALIILFWQLSNLISVFYGTPYVKANKNIIVKALGLADLKRGEIFYDLGCGGGDVLIEAEKFGVKAVGFEISPFYYFLAKLKTLKHLNIEIRFQNIRNIDLSKADVVYCYLLPKFLEKLIPKFQKEMKSDSRLISVGFPIKIKNSTFPTPASKVEKIKVQNRNVYIYRF